MGALLNSDFCSFKSWFVVTWSCGRDGVREEAGGGDRDLLAICNSCEQ